MERHYTRLGVLQSLVSPWKGKKRKKEKKQKDLNSYNKWFSYQVETLSNRA